MEKDKLIINEVQEIEEIIPKDRNNEFYLGMLSSLELLFLNREFKDILSLKEFIGNLKETISKHKTIFSKDNLTLESFSHTFIEDKLFYNLNTQMHMKNKSIDQDENKSTYSNNHLNPNTKSKSSNKSFNNYKKKSSSDVIDNMNNNKTEVSTNTSPLKFIENTMIKKSNESIFYDRCDLDLRTRNELFDREVNLLKSLILINNLHLNTFEKDGLNCNIGNTTNTIISNNANNFNSITNTNIKEKDFQINNQQLFKENYFVSMTEGRSDSISKDKILYQKIQTIHLLTMQISNLGQELKELKTSIEIKKEKFLNEMKETHKKVINAFSHEVKSRRAMRGKVINIEKLI